MSATPEFLSQWRSGNRSGVILARVALRDPVTLAVSEVRAATKSLTTPAGSAQGALFWPGSIISVEPIHAPGSFCETSVSLCTGGIVMANEFDPGGMLLDGAAVTLWLWDDALTNFDHALVLFAGVVVNWSRDTRGTRLQLRQRTDWNRDLTPIKVTPEAYPHAPESSIGQSVPIVYGRLRNTPMRPPWVPYPIIDDGITAFGDRGVSLVFGGRRAGAAVMVDTGRGSGAAGNPAAKILCASHQVKRVSDHANGAGFYLDVGTELLAALEAVTPGTDIINTATEAGLLLRDNAAAGWMMVWPTEVDPVANSAENFRALLDPWNDSNFARCDWTAGYKTIRLRFPSIEEPGDLVQMCAVVGYRSVASTNLTLRLCELDTGFVTDHALATTSTRFIKMGTTGAFGVAAFPDTPWAFSEMEMALGWDTRGPAITGTGTAEFYLAGILINFRPRQQVVLSEKKITTTLTRPVEVSGRQRGPYTVEQTLPAVTEAEGKFFANVDGWGDDGAGTYAGAEIVVKYGAASAITNPLTVNFANAPQIYRDLLDRVSPGDIVTARVGGPAPATVVSWVSPVLTLSSPNTSTPQSATLTIQTKSELIERAPDIAAHMLSYYGGEPIAAVEQAAGEFGSTVDARASLMTYRGKEMVHALSVGKATDVMTALSWLAQDSLSFMFLDRFTDRWKVRPWRTNLPVDYPWTFRPEDIVEKSGPRVSRTPLSSLMTGLTVSYGRSEHRSGVAHSARLAHDGSSAGYRWRGVRDESLKVDSSNNKLHWNVNSTNFSATLSSVSHTPESLMIALNNAMKAQDAARDYIVGHGATIVSGYNDQIQWTDNPAATTRLATLTEGRYTFAQLCAHITEVMNTANGNPPGVIEVSYSPVTRKVGLMTLNRSTVFHQTGAPLRGRRLMATLGFDQTAANVTVNAIAVNAAFEREDEVMILGTNTLALNLLWETGASGLNGTRTDCHSLLGFAGLRDSIGVGAGLGTCLLADSPKSNREAPLLATANRYGARKDSTVDARTILDDETVREMRNQAALLLGKPRVVVEFTTEVAPDLERTRIIQFSSRLDEVVSFPDPESDGTWGGKRFVVVETEQENGPLAFYTKIRAVCLD